MTRRTLTLLSWLLGPSLLLATFGGTAQATLPKVARSLSPRAQHNYKQLRTWMRSNYDHAKRPSWMANFSAQRLERARLSTSRVLLSAGRKVAHQQSRGLTRSETLVLKASGLKVYKRWGSPYGPFGN